jgi:GPH family glycoside/pentoside/hexuronide:cation symporter
MRAAPISFFSKIVFSIGSIAYGVKDSGFNTFLLIYYNQVLGLPALYAGFALLIALVVDALTDPYVGYLSDNLRSRWGRRHPFMYAAILPSALGYFYIWNPPEDLTQIQLFFFLLATAVIVRLMITFYEVPNSAMIAELERDYDRRTSLSAMRLAFGWLGGVIMAAVALWIFLVPTETYEVGQLNKEGYQEFAILAAIVMIVVSLISAVGTHRHIPDLPQASEDRSSSTSPFFKTILTAFESQSFSNLFMGMIFIMLVHGITIVLQLYFVTYFFKITSAQASLLAASMAPAAILAMFLTPLIARGREKRSVAMTLTILQMIIANISIVAHLFGLLPGNDNNALILILFINTLVASAISIALQIILTSMIADLIEDAQKHTGHRSEGLYFAAYSFSRKVLSGLGFFASAVLIYIAGTGASAMTDDSMFTVATYYVPLLVVLHLIALAFIRRFSLSRADHQENLRQVG